MVFVIRFQLSIHGGQWREFVVSMNAENAVEKLSLATKNLNKIVEHLQKNTANIVSEETVERIEQEVQELYENVFNEDSVDNNLCNDDELSSIEFVRKGNIN